MRTFYRIFVPFVFLYLIGISTISRCRRDIYHGDIGGISLSSNKYEAFIPAGMVVVPAGSFIVRGDANYENPFNEVVVSKRVSSNALLCDSKLTTNIQYRLFISKLHEEGGISPIEEEGYESEEERESTVVDEEEFEEEENPITREYIDSVKPDINVWNEFAHHMGDPYVKYYFSHEAFNEYPVVGVTWRGAREFAKWRTRFMNTYRESQGLPPVPDFRLPTPTEYEYASKGGISLAKYPFGNNPRDKYGKLLANFKSQKGDYSESGRNYTSPVGFYPPNGYGIYDMVGNVWEWTLGAKYQGAILQDTWDMNSDYIDDDVPEKVIMGGGAFNAPIYPCGTREYRDKNKPGADVGFRCVMDFFEGVGGENKIEQVED